MHPQQFLGLLDMFDGGGAGRAGDTFKGGPLSGLLNELGIRPRGFNDRQAEPPMPVPPVMRAAPPPPAFVPDPTPAAYAPGAITSMPIGAQMSDDQLLRMVLQALQGAPSATGYGPR